VELREEGVGERMSASRRSEAMSLAERAAIHLMQTDPEFVVGGCSDVSEVISEWLRRKGYSAEPVYGVARRGKQPWFLHAWMNIEGQRFDPVLWVQGMRMQKYSYKAESGVAGALRCDVEYIIESSVGDLDQAIS
jgi:hypothetical protein